MGVSFDIVRSWRHPRQIMAQRLSEGQREDRVLIFLMLACLMIFISRWPGLAREAYIDPSTPLDIRLGGALFGWIFIAPLFLYGLAALSRIVARLVGGQGSWYSARMALAWSLLAAAPIWLINGLVVGFLDPGPLHSIVGAIAFGVFIALWLASMLQSEFGGKVL